MRTYSKPQRRRTSDGKLVRYYSVRCYDRATGKRSWISTGCATKKAAEEWLRTRLMAEAMGPDRVAAQEFASLTFAEAMERWLETKRGLVTEARLTILESRAQTYWVPFFGKMILRAITADDVRKYLRRRQAGAFAGKRAGTKPAPATVNDDLVQLKGFFKAAAGERWIERNPASMVKGVPGTMRRRVRTLSATDEEKLLEACRTGTTKVLTINRNAGGRRGGKSTEKKSTFPQTTPPPPYLYLLVVLALYTGLRRRTLLSVRWRDVDLEHGHWRIPGEFMKAGQDYDAPLTPLVREALLEFQAVQAQKKDAAALLAKDAPILGLRPDTQVGRSFGSAVKRAGLEGLTLHDLRRAFLNRLRASGVPLDVAMRLSDSRDIKTVMAHYREIPDAELRNAMTMLHQHTRAKEGAG